MPYAHSFSCDAPSLLLSHLGVSLGLSWPGAGGPGTAASSGTDLTDPMDHQVVRRDDVALPREGAQVYLSSSSQEQVNYSTASLADEMIVLPGLGIESSSLFVQQEGTDLTLLDETVKVAIHGGETDPRQLLVNPSVDLMGKRMRVIALESGEHLLQLTCRTFASGPSHRLPRILAIGRIDRASVDAGLSNEGFAVKRSRDVHWPRSWHLSTTESISKTSGKPSRSATRRAGPTASPSFLRPSLWSRGCWPPGRGLKATCCSSSPLATSPSLRTKRRSTRSWPDAGRSTFQLSARPCVPLAIPPSSCTVPRRALEARPSWSS